MYILKNAWISIIRNKGRNLLIGVIILVIAYACTVTLAINNTASDLINSYDNAYDKELVISFDRSSMKENFNFSKGEGMEEAKEAFEKIESYSIADVKSFAESNHIEDYYYTYSILLNGNNIEKAEYESSNSHGGRNNISSNSMDFTLSGYSSIDSMSEFINGTYTMSEIVENAWEIAFTGNYVFINQELASYNNLSLNDTIILEDESGNTYEFEIIGIFEDNASEETSMMKMFSNSVNTIVTNSDTLISITSDNDSITGTINPTFIIDDYDNAFDIQEEFYEKGLDKSYIIETNQDVAEAGLSSIKNVKSFANTFLIITLIIGGIVLFVINMINIRERKYEIGVLRTIGMSKLKLTLQFTSELLIVAFVALIIGAGIGAITSKGISNSLLSSEIESSKSIAEEMKNNFGGKGKIEEFNNMSGVPNIQAYDSINAVVDTTVILELLTISLLLVLVSSIASMISIQRFTPLTILKERS